MNLFLLCIFHYISNWRITKINNSGEENRTLKGYLQHHSVFGLSNAYNRPQEVAVVLQTFTHTSVTVHLSWYNTINTKLHWNLCCKYVLVVDRIKASKRGHGCKHMYHKQIFKLEQGNSTQENKHLPHGVKQSAIILQPQQLVGRSHVVSDRFLAVKEEGIGSPDIAGQQVIQRQHLHGTFEAQTLILPALTEEHVNGVFLKGTQKGWEWLKIALDATVPPQEGKEKPHKLHTLRICELQKQRHQVRWCIRSLRQVFYPFKAPFNCKKSG